MAINKGNQLLSSLKKMLRFLQRCAREAVLFHVYFCIDWSIDAYVLILKFLWNSLKRIIDLLRKIIFTFVRYNNRYIKHTSLSSYLIVCKIIKLTNYFGLVGLIFHDATRCLQSYTSYKLGSVFSGNLSHCKLSSQIKEKGVRFYLLFLTFWVYGTYCRLHYHEVNFRRFSS